MVFESKPSGRAAVALQRAAVPDDHPARHHPDLGQRPGQRQPHHPVPRAARPGALGAYNRGAPAVLEQNHGSVDIRVRVRVFPET